MKQFLTARGPIMLSLLIFVLAVAAPLRAQLPENEFDLSIGHTEFLGTVEGDALAYGLHYTRFLTRGVSARFGLTIMNGDVDEVVLHPGDVIPPGRFEIFMLSGLVQYHWRRDKSISPYLRGGAALVFSQIGNVSAEDKVTGLVAGGADLTLSPAWAATAGVTYMPYQGHYTRPSFFTSPRAGTDIDVDPLTLSAGLKFRW